MKVGKKARRGRIKRPVPHKPHRKKGGISDPISRARKADWKRRKQAAAERTTE